MVELDTVVLTMGSLLVGFVFGWMLVHAAYEGKEFDWKGYVAVLGAVVGGVGVDYLFKTAFNFVGYFWIGIFVGFLVNILIRYRLQKPNNVFRKEIYEKGSSRPTETKPKESPSTK